MDDHEAWLGRLCGFERKAGSSSNNLTPEMRAARLTVLDGLLRRHIRNTLDDSFAHETELSEMDFSDLAATSSLLHLYEQLDGHALEHLVRSGKTSADLHDVLGIELSECLLWRRGALRYMVSLSLLPDLASDARAALPAELTDDTDFFVSQAVALLLQMLLLRETIAGVDAAALQPHDDMSQTAGQIEVAKLLVERVYSTVHLLAIIYAAELCVRLARRASTTPLPQALVAAWLRRQAADVTWHELAEQLLTLYMHIVCGIIPGRGWTPDRAVVLLARLRGVAPDATAPADGKTL